jgi:hypothetical protein
MSQTYLDPAASRRKKRRRALLAVLLGASILTLGSGAFSLALFTDSATAGGSWTTGTIVLDVVPSTTFTATGIMPGDSGSQTVTVQNNGTGALRYSMSSTATNLDGKGLRGQLQLTIKEGSCPSSGTTLYSAALSGAGFGSSATGFQDGDRALAASGNDLLCFSWDFPGDSGNGYQSATTSATFTFDAEQTANN